MPTFLFVVFTQPVPGEDDAYNAWYDDQHAADVLAVEGVTAVQRYEAVKGSGEIGELPPYLALYEVEAEHPDRVQKALERAGAAGRMPVSDALDVGATITRYFKPHGSRQVST